MKLKIDFSGFAEVLEAMGASKADVGSLSDHERKPISEIEAKLLETGSVEVDLADISVLGGLLAAGHTQAILHIPTPHEDQDSLEKIPAERTRFHLVDCKTLEQKRADGSFERYIASTNTDRYFSVKAKNIETGKWDGKKFQAVLAPCYNCLKKLNYKNFEYISRSEKKKIWLVDPFPIEEFFDEHKYFFRTLPIYNEHNYPDPSEYTDNWVRISKEFRENKGWICECCKGNFSTARQYLHVHHIDMNKRNNRSNNLSSLCALCHQKQPRHGTMYVSNAKQNIKNLRKQQKLPLTCPKCES